MTTTASIMEWWIDRCSRHWQEYLAGRRTLNNVIARASREGRIFTRDPRTPTTATATTATSSNEWELVTLESAAKRAVRGPRQHRAAAGRFPLVLARPAIRPLADTGLNVHTIPGRNAHELLWNSGAALLSILGLIYPRDSVAEIAAAIARYDAGWSHAFRSDLDQHRPILRLRLRGGGDRSHRGCARHVA